nr:RNA recognition motif 2 family protein [Zea mays]|eukprot:NP_001151419.1 RNA recognition motif 2 family protein [Zea mays]
MVQRPLACVASAAAGNANEAATNQPSPRSVLAVTSPPISPTTSLPTSFPYRLAPPAPPPTAGHAAPTPPPTAKRSVAARPRHGRRSSRVRRTRSAPKPRRLFDPTSELTSFMIRNIPNDFTRARLIHILDQHCSIENEKIAPGGVRSQYDFLYLVVDFRSRANKGYAFVNMTSPEAARRLWTHLHGHLWAFKSSAKTCAVDYADLQGQDNLVSHFSGSRFDCDTDEYLPVRFEPPRDGTRPAEGAMNVVGRRITRSRPSDEN